MPFLIPLNPFLYACKPGIKDIDGHRVGLVQIEYIDGFVAGMIDGLYAFGIFESDREIKIGRIYRHRFHFGAFPA